jgi:hypothetical protein
MRKATPRMPASFLLLELRLIDWSEMVDPGYYPTVTRATECHNKPKEPPLISKLSLTIRQQNPLAKWGLRVGRRDGYYKMWQQSKSSSSMVMVV